MRDSYTDEEMNMLEELQNKPSLTDEEMGQLESLMGDAPSTKTEDPKVAELLSKDSLTDEEMSILEASDISKEEEVANEGGFLPPQLQDTTFSSSDIATTKSDVKHATEFIEGVRIGAREQLDPFHIVSDKTSKEDEQAAAGARGAIGRVVGNFGVDMAITAITGTVAAAAAGAVAGSVIPIAGTAVGAVLAGVTFASVSASSILYRAFGTENIESERRDEAFNYKRVALNSIVELNPALKYVGKGAKISKAVVQSGLSVSQAAAYDADTSGIVAAGVLGLGMGYVTKGHVTTQSIIKAAKNPKEIIDMLNINHTVSLSKSLEVAQPISHVEQVGALTNKHQKFINIYLDNAIEEGRVVNKAIGTPKHFTYKVNEAGEDVISGFQPVGDLTSMSMSQYAKANGLRLESVDMGKRVTAVSRSNGVIFVSNRAEELIAKPQSLGIDKMRKKIEAQVQGYYKDYIDYIKANGKMSTEEAMSQYNKLGKERQEFLWASFVSQNVRKDAITKATRSMGSSELGTSSDLSKISTYFGDGLLEARRVDVISKGTTNFEPVINELVKAETKASMDLAVWLETWTKLSTKLKKTNNYENAFDILDKPHNYGATTAEIKEVQAYLKQFGEYVKMNGFEINDIKNYIHYTQRKDLSLAKNFNRNVSILENMPAGTDEYNIAAREVKNVMAGEFGIKIDDDMEFMSVLKGSKKLPDYMNKGKYFDVAELKEYGNRLFDGRGDIKTRAGGNADLASGMKERSGMNEGYVETDLDTVMKTYLSDMVNTIHNSIPQQKWLAELKVLKTLNRETSGNFAKAQEWAEWMLSASLKGVDPNRTMKNMTSGVKVKLKKSFSYILDDVTKENKMSTRVLEAVTDLPDMLADMSSSIYSMNLGGVYIYKSLRNMLQPLTMTAPEMSKGTYGFKLLGSQIGNTAKNYKTLKAEMATKGLLNTNQDKLMGYLKENTAKNAAITTRFNNKMMALFTKTEEMNRVHVYNMCKQMSRDVIVNGNKDAFEAIMRRSPSFKLQASKLIDANDIEGLGDVLAQDVLGHSMFHYSKLTQSKFQQQFGTLTSMFTKWPTMTIGKATQLYQDKEWQQLSMQFLLIPALLAGSRELLDKAEITDSPRTEIILGRGKADWASAAALSSALSIQTPVLVDGLSKALEGVSDITEFEPRKGIKKIAGAIANTTGAGGFERQINLLWQTATGEPLFDGRLKADKDDPFQDPFED